MRASLPARPDLSVIVPLSDDPTRTRSTLAALAASTLPRRRWELIAVDSGQSDDVVDIARQHATEIVSVSPMWRDRDTYLFNRGAEVARAPILVLLAADVCVHPDTLDQMRRALLNQSLTAVVATIDPPRLTDAVTRAAMLSEQWGHSRCTGSSEFLAVHAAAIRARAFAEAGQLDEWQPLRGETAAMEFGLRLTALGYRIELRKGVRVTPLRRIPWRQALRPSALRRTPPSWLPMPLSRSQMTATGRFRRRERLLSAALWAATAGVVWGRAASSQLMMAVAGAGLLAIVLDPSHLLHVWKSAGLSTSLLASFMRSASLATVTPRHVFDHARFRVRGEPPADPGMVAWSELMQPKRVAAPVRAPATTVERIPVHAETASVASL